MKAYQWKGPGSLRPCLKHPNVVKKNSKFREASFVEIDCTDHLKFQATTDHSLYAKADFMLEARSRWHRRELTKTRYDELETAAGFATTPNGLLASAMLRSSDAFSPTAAHRYDWVHSALQDGMMSVESFLIVVALETKAGVTMEDLENFCRLPWCTPSSSSSTLGEIRKVFAASRSSETKLKASCSNMLGAYMILRHYLELHDHPEIEEERKVFMLASECLDTGEREMTTMRLRSIIHHVCFCILDFVC